VNAYGEADRDRDGLPDGWEQFYVADTTNLPAAVDSDRDGLDNESEWVAGTHPQRGAEYFAAEVADTEGGHPVIRWASSDGRAYDVAWSPDLAAPFSILAAGLPATPPVNVYTDVAHVAAERGFYRVTVRLSP
jgi:hypothetical protein